MPRLDRFQPPKSVFGSVSSSCIALLEAVVVGWCGTAVQMNARHRPRLPAVSPPNQSCHSNNSSDQVVIMHSLYCSHSMSIEPTPLYPSPTKQLYCL